jgi:hypothetical protein
LPPALPIPGPNRIPLARETGPGFLRVVSPAQLDLQEQERLAQLSAARRPLPTDNLAQYIRTRWDAMRNHRNSNRNPLNQRLLRAQRMFEGQYDPAKLAEIRKFGGSEVYSRIVAVKCRGATSLLRDVYMGAERPWSIDPQPDPPVPPEIMAQIAHLVSIEAAQQHVAGAQMPSEDVHARFVGLVRQAQQAARRTATQQAEAASNKVEDILEAGNFYDALAEFLVDVALFPFAVLKGPVVRMVPKLVWQGRTPNISTVPQLFWERVDPFNLYWDPGATDIEHAELIERKKLTRSDLNDVLGLPGYNDAAIRGALEDYAHGLRDWMDAPDTEQALNAGRESPVMNRSNMIDAIEYHGSVQGRTLLNEGLPPAQVPDPDRDYLVQSWVVGRYTIKTQIAPSPRKRHPYYVTSFEKVPGTIAGHGLPDILEDIQEVANATLRSLVNNMSIASGPQVVINTELLDPTVDEDALYPWKRWKVNSDPLGSTREPVTFFQPASNAQELMMIYQGMSALGDDTSAIPRYVTGESLSGGAGRTASGLSMLMGNAQKVLQTVAANIDIDVMRGVLSSLYDMIMLTDQSGLLSGDEQIKVNGVVVALQKETEQQKQLQFLQITGNPIDMQIVGMTGRARVLRSLASGLGLPDDIVPDDDTIQQKENQQQQLQAAALMMQAGRAAPPGGGAPLPGGGAPQAPTQAQAGQGMPSIPPASLSQVAPPVNTVSPQ